jgi:LysM repeat protein
MTEEAPPEADSPTPTPTPTRPGAAYRTYVVQRGDILKQIAARYGVSMASIIAINNIPNPDSLQVGQVLNIPPAG